MEYAQDSTPRSEATGAPSDRLPTAHAATIRKILAEMAADNQQFADVATGILDDLQLQARELAAHMHENRVEAVPDEGDPAAPGNTAMMRGLLAEIRSARAQVQNLQEEVHATRQQIYEGRQRSRNKLAEILQLAVNEADIP